MAKPSVDNLVTGGGSAYGAPWSGSTPPGDGALAHLGNCPKLSVNWEEETLVHESSQSYYLEEDAEVTVKKNANISIELEELDQDNLAIFFQATKPDANTLRPLQSTNQYYRIKFVPAYPSGDEWTYDFHKVKLKPAGELNLISMNEWAKMTMEGKVVADTANNPNSPYWDQTLGTE